MLVGKARSLPEYWHTWCFTWVGSCLTLKHHTILERLARDEHSSLLHKFVNYDRIKSFVALTPGANVLKLFLSEISDFRTKLECLSD